MQGKVLQWIVAIGCAALLAACGSANDTFTPPSGSPPTPPFTQIKASPDSFKGQAVVLGGQVLTARRLKDATRIEVLQLPLNDSHQPTMDLTKSEGRFVAIQREFLDPATIPHGTFVTVAGDLTGSMTLPLDESEYTYPVVEIKNMRTWIPQEPLVVRPRPYPYYSPYWHPYWGPYRPYPYW